MPQQLRIIWTPTLCDFDNIQPAILLFGEPAAPTIPNRASPERSDYEVLYFLADPPKAPLTRAQLIDCLWPDSPTRPSDARATLRVRLSHLRKAVPSVAVSLPNEEESLILETPVLETIDLYQFNWLLEEAGRASDTEEEDRLIRLALKLYTGPLLPKSRIRAICVARKRYQATAERARERLEHIQSAAESGCATELRKSAGEEGCEEVERTAESQVPTVPPADYQRITDLGAPSRVNGRKSSPDQPKGLRRRCGARELAVIGALAILVALILWRIHPLAVPGTSRSTVADKVRELRSIRSISHRNDPLENRRAELCIELAEEAAESWNRAGEREWIGTIGQIEPDIEASVIWLSRREPEKAVQLIGALSRYWSVKDEMAKARGWLEPVLGRLPHSESPIRARAVTLYAMCLVNAAEDRGPQARKAGIQALSVIRQAHDIYVSLRDEWGQANTVRCMGHVFLALNRQEEAEENFFEAKAQFERLPPSDRRTAGLASTYWALALVTRPDGPNGLNCFRQLDLFLRSAALWKGLGSESGFARMVQESTGRISAIYALPNRHVTRDRLKLIQQYVTTSTDYLSTALLQSDRGELNNVHKAVLRAALLLGDRQLFIEQVAFFIGRWSDLPPSRVPLVASYYVLHMHEHLHTPLSEDAAKATLSEALRSHHRLADDASMVQARSARLSPTELVDLVIR